MLIQKISYYSTSKYFDNAGKKQALAKYNKFELNPYVEYGLRDWLTVGANLFVQRASQYNSGLGRDQANWGIGDSEFFLRSRIWKGNGFVFSAEPMIKLPSLEKASSQPQIGNNNYDAGITFSGGYGFKAWQLDHFINLDTGYRHRFGKPHDQFKFSAAAGISVTKHFQILTQAFNTSRATDNIPASFTQSSQDDYDLTQLQVSALYKIDDKFSIQLGGFSNISGKNIGSGDGALFAVSKEF